MPSCNVGDPKATSIASNAEVVGGAGSEHYYLRPRHRLRLGRRSRTRMQIDVPPERGRPTP